MKYTDTRKERMRDRKQLQRREQQTSKEVRNDRTKILKESKEREVPLETRQHNERKRETDKNEIK